MNNQQITLQDVLIWIIQNQYDTDAMDKINRQSYPYTSKFNSPARKFARSQTKLGLEGGNGSTQQ